MDIKKAREELRKGKTIYDMNLSVGYYARVSTDKDDQLNSLENQQKYFEEMISEIRIGIYIVDILMRAFLVQQLIKENHSYK